MKIAEFASECNPFFKTGGLADVAYALSHTLKELGHEVIVGLPYYKTARLEETPEYLGSYDVYLSWRVQEAKIFHLKKAGVDFYFIQNDYYFGRERLYGYDDDGERFAFFSLACRTLLKFLSFRADIVQVHDWQTAMLPCLIKEGLPFDPFYQKMHYVLTIHNPAFKGILDRYFLHDFFGLDDSLYFTGKVRFEGMVSTLKSGIVYADKVTTVSPTHRNELLSPEGGQGLDGVLRFREGDFVGILNGIDTEEWDASKDPFIKASYDLKNRDMAFKENRKDLLESMGLKDADVPVYGIVSRLSWQKGIDLIIDDFYSLLREKDARLVILGSGEYGLEQRAEALRREFSDKVAIYIGYNETLAHKVYAGIDFFLMPSLFEPCGISQMISQRYGALPIVRYTGGLADTVCGYIGSNLETADGIGFNDYNDAGLSYGLNMSLALYGNKEAHQKVIANAMRKDQSWKKSARLYEGLFESLIH